MTCPYSALFVPSLISSSLEIYREAVVSQWLSCVQLFAAPWTAALQASLFFTIPQSLLKLMSIESVMPSNHLILCHPLLLWPSVFPSIRVFSNELPLCIRWPKYWSFSFSFSPYNKYSGFWSCIHSKSPCWNLSDVFLMIKLDLCVLGEEDQSNKVAFFYHILARVHTINITYCCWCWPWSFSCSGMCQVSLKPLPTPLLLGWSHDHTANGESYILPPWRQNFCVHYLEFFCSGNLSLLPICLLTYLYQYGLMDVYVVL